LAAKDFFIPTFSLFFHRLVSSVGRQIGKPCTYESVDDETAAMAFQLLGLPSWAAEGNVETLRFFRTGQYVFVLLLLFFKKKKSHTLY
jgi:hypothetical protein